MAVVEKKPETGTARPLALGLASLAGVAYVLGSIFVAFKAVPVVFGLVGMDPANFGVLAGFVSIIVLVALAIVGFGMVGGTHSRPGLRAGIFLGLVFVFLWAVLSRWLGGILEGWAYGGLFGQREVMIGGGISAVLSGLLGFWLLRIFLRPTMERRFLALESAGWFTASTYKAGQGTRVRRGTILGILLMTGGGIWVLLHRGTLERGAPDWTLDVPFTATEAITEPGDALAADRKEAALDRVRVLDAGSAKGTLTDNTTIDRDTALKAILPLAKEKREKLGTLLAKLKKRKDEKREGVPQELVEKEKGLLQTWIDQLNIFDQTLATAEKKPDSDNLFLIQRELERFVTAEQDRERERRRSDQTAEQYNSLKKELNEVNNWANEPRLPVIAEVFTRFAVRDINERLDPLLYRIVKKEETFERLPRQYQFKNGQRIDRNEFDEALEKLKPSRPADTNDRTAQEEWVKEVRRIETRAKESAPEARPMKGTTYYASLTLLPSVRYTLPLLLLALSIWLAWRIVNLPTFADFLIATESEMNKVSWTTRPRLLQDTVVVLVTMVLLAVFLFVVDIAWARLLSSSPIGVLKTAPPKVKAEKGDKLKW